MRLLTLAFVAAVVGDSPDAHGFTGGPVRAEIVGYAPVDARIYFRLHAQDDSGSPPRAWYIDLDGTRPRRPVRARSVEDPDTTYGGSWTTPAWQALRRRLVPLVADSVSTLEWAARATTSGEDTGEQVAILPLSVDLRSAGRSAHVDVTAFCNPMVGVRGIYGIPGREERLVVLTYVGRAYGCQEVETPIVLE